MTLTLSGSLREQHKVRTRQALADAALAILSEGGVEAVTADSVAARAGLSRRTFFNYFARVEDVLTETCRQATASALQRFEARPAGEPLADSVRAVLEATLQDPAIPDIVELNRAALTSPSVRAFLPEYQEEQADVLNAGLRARIPDVDPIWAATLTASIAAVVARVPREVVAAHPDEANAALADRTHAAVVTSIGLVFDGFTDTMTRKA